MVSLTPRAIAVSCAAIAVAVPGTFLVIRAMRRPRKYAGPHYTTAPVAQWNVQQVAQWLQSLTVSEGALVLFLKNDVDGSMLLLLDENHLSKLAPKLRDLVFIREGLKKLRVQTAHVLPPEGELLVLEPSVPRGDERREGGFLDVVNARQRALPSREVAPTTTEEQRVIRQQCAQVYQEVMNDVQDLSPELQTKLLPFITKVKNLAFVPQKDPVVVPAISIIEEEDDEEKRTIANTAATRKGPITIPPAPTELLEQVRILYDMMDNISHVLDSAGVSLMLDSQAAPLRDQIGSQLMHIMEVVKRLPPQYGEPLRRKCEEVLQRIQQNTASNAFPLASMEAQGHQQLQGQSQPQSQTALIESVMRQLAGIFTTLRSSDILSMQPSMRLAHVTSMLKEVKQIKEKAEEWDDTNATDVVLRITGEIIPVLQQMRSLTLEELGSTADDVMEEQNEGPREEVNPIQIVASLKDIIQALHSDELANAPSAVQQPMLSRIYQDLLRLRHQINSLPRDRNSLMLIEMFEKTQQLVALRLMKNPEGMERRDEPEEDRMEVPPNVSRANEDDLKPQEANVDALVADLERVFEYINSEAFEALPPQERREMSRKQLSIISNVEKKSAQCGGQAMHLLDLIRSMKNILQLEAGEEPMAPEPTPLFLTIVSHLTEMSKILKSDDFMRADQERKRATARCLIPRLQELSSTYRQLPDHERASVEKMISPINNILINVVRQKGPTATAAVATVNPTQVMEQVEGLLSTLQSEEFLNAPFERRQCIALALVKKLEGLEEDCSHIGGTADQLLPIIRLLATQLRPFVQNNNTVAEDLNNRVVLVDAAPAVDGNEVYESGVREFTQKQGVNNVAIEEQQGITRDMTGISEEVRNGKDATIMHPRQAKQSLRELLQLATSAGIDTGSSRRELENHDTTMQRPWADTKPPSDAFNPDLQKFLHTFSALKSRISTWTPSSMNDLIPIMKAVDEELKRVEHKVAWKQSPQALKLVAEVVSRIMQLQSVLSSSQHIDEKTNPNTNEQEVSEKLPKILGEVETQMRVSSGNEREGDLLFSEAPQASEFPREFVSMAERGLCADEQEKESGNDMGMGDDRDVDDETECISGLLLDMSNQLREGYVSNEVLDEYSRVLDGIKSMRTYPFFSETVDAVQEQIHLQRIQNNGDDDDNTDDVTDEESAIEDKEKESANLQGVQPIADTDVFKISLDELLDKGVPGMGENELFFLLPRIEKRLECAEDEFIANTTLFDIQSISKVILHLGQNEVVKDSGELSHRVNCMKKTFARLLEAFHCSDKQSAAVQSALRMQCRDILTAGESVREIVLCTAAEATEGAETWSNGDLLKCLTEGKATETTVNKDVVESWMGKSIALLFCEMGEMEGTALSELGLLHEVLVKRYGFDVVTVRSASATQLCGLLREIVESGATRLFLYYLTDTCGSSPHTVSFRDGSVLPHRIVLEQTATVDRVVVAHCQPLKLTVVSAMAGCGGQFLSVELTEAANTEVRASHCWLFDGLFTPAVTELLCLDEGRMLCPEDLVTYAVTPMSSLRVDFGSFTKGESSSMGFFVPFDDSD